MQDIYLKINGVDGECESQGFVGWIEVSNVAFAIGKAAEFAEPAPEEESDEDGAEAPDLKKQLQGRIKQMKERKEKRESARTQRFPAVKVSKLADKAMPKIFDLCAKETVITDIKLTFCRAGAPRVNYVEMTFKKCLISSADLKTGSGEGIAEQEFEFTYEEVNLAYTETNRTDGKMVGGPAVRFAFNVNNYTPV